MIDPKAVVHPNANIGKNVTIGPWTRIEADVSIGDGTRIDEHVIIRSNTNIGTRNRIYAFCSIGEDPQHLKYTGEASYLEIGNNNIFREYSAIHRGSMLDDKLTRIGHNNYFMAYVHIGHDCKIGNHNLFVIGSAIGGHVQILNHCNIGAHSIIHQYCRVGSYTMIAPVAVCRHDIPPYVIAKGDSATHSGVLNLKGLRNVGFDEKQIRIYRRAYRTIFRSRLNRSSAIERLKKEISDHSSISEILEFIEQPSQRGLMR